MKIFYEKWCTFHITWAGKVLRAGQCMCWHTRRQAFFLFQINGCSKPVWLFIPSSPLQPHSPVWLHLFPDLRTERISGKNWVIGYIVYGVSKKHGEKWCGLFYKHIKVMASKLLPSLIGPRVPACFVSDPWACGQVVHWDRVYENSNFLVAFTCWL